MKCLVELRPNRKLLQPNFDGYKLSLEPIPTWRQTLEVKVDRVYPSDDQYSLIHAKLFGLHNHLINDFWANSGVYFIDEHWKVNKVALNSNQSLQDIEHVYEVPSHIERQPGHYHVSLQFCTEQYALLADGAGSLHIVKTGNRNRIGIKWDCVFSDQVLGSGVCFEIVDSRIEYEEGKETVHCLLQHIQQRDKTFDTVIEWVSLKRENHVWSVVSIKQLKGQGSLHYVALEPRGRGLYLASDHSFHFTSDLNSEETEEAEISKEKNLVYTWLQTGEDITLTLQLDKNYNKTLLNVETSSKSINLVYNNVELLKGELHMAIDHDLTTWNIENNGKLDVLLTKSASGAMWASFLKGGDQQGEQVMDHGLVEAVHRRLAHLCSDTEGAAEGAPPAFSNQQLEECDAVSEENTCLVRIDATSHKVTHQAPLSVHQVVLTVALTPSEPLALGLRHDVDTCVWQPSRLSDDGQIWPVKHEGTLLAFGYVQSSKQQKKFTVCPPNMEYSVVCEATRHMFVYRSRAAPRQGCVLRQRIGDGENRQVNIGQQQVVSLDRDGEVLGICATNETLYLLTEKFVIALQMT